jgi:diacylglycerol kinase family enzyme
LRVFAPEPVAAAEIPVILNDGSGGGRSREQAERLFAAFRDAGLRPKPWPVAPGADVRALARRALKPAPRVLAVAGGDGTVGAVADVVRGTGTALAVIPVGTLNHFAKDLGLPLDPAQAVRVIAQGRRIRVDVGEVNGRAFVNNASLGLYADIVRKRKRHQRRLRRSKRMAMLWATLEALGSSRLLDLSLELEDRVQAFRAPFVFVGNNDYTMEGFDIGTRARLDAGVLDVYTTRRSTTAGLVGLALRALFGRLRQADDFVATGARSLRVDSPRRRLVVATDGELSAMDTPLEFRIRPRSLEVIVPEVIV